MIDESTFLAALAAQADDDVTRLAFADWLDEHDQTDKARFLRDECDQHAHPRDRRRLDRLTILGQTLSAEWLAAVGRPRVSGTVWVHQPTRIRPPQPSCGLYFRPDGVVHYFYPNARHHTTPGAWKQFGSRITYHIDQGQSGRPYSFHTARIDGARMRVSSRNVDGLKWRWSIELSNLPPPTETRPGRRKK
jgi:uncharacterized protein (TIGR02996 family)